MRDYLVVCVGCNKTHPVVYDVIKVDKKMEDEIFSFNDREFDTLEECNRSIEYDGELGSLVHRFRLSLNRNCQKTDEGKFITFLEGPYLDEGYSELKTFKFKAEGQDVINKVFDGQCGESCFMYVLCIEKPPHNTIFDMINAINVI